MTHVSILISLSLLATGCTTARLSGGPDVYALAEHANALRMGVTQIVDERKSDHLGTVGAAGIRVRREDVTELATNYLLHILNAKMDTNVVRVNQVTPSDIPALVEREQIDGVIVCRIKNLSLFSIDAIMQPTKVEMDLEVEVYNRAGALMYSEIANGYYSKRIWPMTQNGAGKLVESAIQDVMSKLAKDSYLKKSLTVVSA